MTPLVLGAQRVDRIIEGADRLLLSYREDSGSLYLDYRPVTPADVLTVEDLAVTALINSRFGLDAARSVVELGRGLNLCSLPDVSLEESSDAQRQAVAEVIAEMVGWRGIGTSIATKALHKKRPALIPILDNQAIFGAYMNPRWPSVRSSADSVYSALRIKEALDWIATDTRRSENEVVWAALSRLEPDRTRIQLFDSVWWMYFRSLEAVQGTAPKAVVQQADTDRGVVGRSGFDVGRVGVASMVEAALEGDPRHAPILELVRRIRVETGRGVPLPNPSGPGLDARIVLVLSDPGPKAVDSGVLATSNDDPTARRVKQALGDAGIEEQSTLPWNAVPWILEQPKANAADEHQGATYLADLVGLFSQAPVVVAMGNVAKSTCRRAAVDAIGTWHPSNRGVNGGPNRYVELVDALKLARQRAFPMLRRP